MPQQSKLLPHEQFWKDLAKDFSDAVVDELRLRELWNSPKPDDEDDMKEWEEAIKEREESLRRKINKLAHLPEISRDSVAGYHPLYDYPGQLEYANSLIHWWTDLGGRRACIKIAKATKTLQRDLAGQTAHPEVPMDVSESVPSQITRRIKQARKELEKIQRFCNLIKSRARAPEVIKLSRPATAADQPMPVDSGQAASVGADKIEPENRSSATVVPISSKVAAPGADFVQTANSCTGRDDHLAPGSIEQRLAKSRKELLLLSESQRNAQNKITKIEKIISELPKESEKPPYTAEIKLPQELTSTITTTVEKEVTPFLLDAHSQCKAGIDSFSQVRVAQTIHVLGPTWTIIQAFLDYYFPDHRTRNCPEESTQSAAQCTSDPVQNVHSHLDHSRPRQDTQILPSIEQHASVPVQSALSSQTATQTVMSLAPPGSKGKPEDEFPELDMKEVGRIFGIFWD